MTDNDTLSQIEFHLAQATALMATLRNGESSVTATVSVGKPIGNNKSLREWVAWLKRTGQPALRQTIHDATGINLTAHKSSILEWSIDMAYWPDEQVPADTLCRTRANSTRPGAPQSIYFLWSQRFDVHRVFGVGPSERLIVEQPTTILGVIHPPTPATGAVPWDQMEFDWSVVTYDTTDTDEDTDEDTAVTRGYQPYASMDDWHARWDPLLNMLAPYEEKPTPEEQEEMLGTLPAGTDDPKAILAVAYSQAYRRSLIQESNQDSDG